MVEEGAQIRDFERAYAELLALNDSASCSKEAILNFASRIGFEKIQGALKELTAPLPKDFVIGMTPHAKDILTFFKPKYFLALVTCGYPPFQREKMEKAGLDCSVFSKIAIPEDHGKKPIYEGLIREFSKDLKKVWVCGDRVEMDLAPAHELGVGTIHMRWGRGKIGAKVDWIHHSISSLLELKGIIK
jgi:FMN phosphatase YigB (HAD superfamily)